MPILFPPLNAGQLGLLNYSAPTQLVVGAGVLNGAATQNLPTVTGEPPTGTCSLYDVAELNAANAATPLATIAANQSSAGLGLAFTNGLAVVPSAWQACSVAVQPSPQAVVVG